MSEQLSVLAGLQVIPEKLAEIWNKIQAKSFSLGKLVRTSTHKSVKIYPLVINSQCWQLASGKSPSLGHKSIWRKTRVKSVS